MSFEQYGQFPNPGQEGPPGQVQQPQDGSAQGQGNDPNAGNMAFPQAQDGNNTSPGGQGAEGKTTLWYTMPLKSNSIMSDSH